MHGFSQTGARRSEIRDARELPRTHQAPSIDRAVKDTKMKRNTVSLIRGADAVGDDVERPDLAPGMQLGLWSDPK